MTFETSRVVGGHPASRGRAAEVPGGQGVEPSELPEPGKVRVGTDDNQAVFEGQSGERRIADQVAPQVELAHQPPKDFTVPAARLRHPRRRGVEPVGDKRPCVGRAQRGRQGHAGG